MNKFKILTFIGAMVLFLSGCAPMNTEFSCKATALDKCLSIEEVNAMTESFDAGAETRVLRHKPYHPRPKPQFKQLSKNTSQTIWIAPWTDENGKRHENDILLAEK